MPKIVNDTTVSGPDEGRLPAPSPFALLALWSAAFALFTAAYWPVLTRPRLDGQPG